MTTESGTIRSTTIPLRGPYDLGEVSSMGFGHRDEHDFDGVMRLAFRVDGLEQHAGVEVRQHSDALELTVHGDAPLDVVARQVARVVSADHDGDAWAAVCTADPVLSRVHAAAPGFRPSNFYSPYEAAVWAILSARRSRAQGIALRRRLSEAHGAVFALAGGPEAALPTPGRLLEIESLPGLPVDRIPRLRAIAEAALDGALDIDRLTGMSRADAMADLQRLPGVGPFYSTLIVVRACGLADVFSAEAHTRAAVQHLYGLDHEPAGAEVEAIAEAWRPFRTWAAVALRAVGSRLDIPG